MRHFQRPDPDKFKVSRWRQIVAHPCNFLVRSRTAVKRRTEADHVSVLTRDKTRKEATNRHPPLPLLPILMLPQTQPLLVQVWLKAPPTRSA